MRASSCGDDCASPRDRGILQLGAQRARLGQVLGVGLARDVGDEIVERAGAIAGRGARDGAREARLLDVERDGAVDQRAHQRFDVVGARHLVPDGRPVWPSLRTPDASAHSPGPSSFNASSVAGGNLPVSENDVTAAATKPGESASAWSSSSRPSPTGSPTSIHSSAFW